MIRLPRHPQRRLRAAFTLLEVILALGLASVIVVGVFGMLTLLQTAESRSAARFHLITDRAIAQNVLRTTLRRLFAAEPLPEPATGSNPPAEEGAERREGESAAETDAAREEEDRQPDQGQENEIASLVRESLGDSELADRILESMRNDEPAHFMLHIPEGGELSPGFPRLEAVLTESPVAIRPLVEDGRVVRSIRAADDYVRGAIEFAPSLSGDSNVLQWRPIDPPGLPTVLLEGVDEAIIEVLPKRAQGAEWANLWAAYLQEDYPVAVRIVLWMRDGSMIDWLFDLTVLTPTPSMKGYGLGG